MAAVLLNPSETISIFQNRAAAGGARPNVVPQPVIQPVVAPIAMVARRRDPILFGHNCTARRKGKEIQE